MVPQVFFECVLDLPEFKILKVKFLGAGFFTYTFMDFSKMQAKELLRLLEGTLFYEYACLIYPHPISSFYKTPLCPYTLLLGASFYQRVSQGHFK